MKIGIMNNPSKSVYGEATFCGKAGFDFFDLTIEGPNATTVDIDRLRSLLETYDLSITGHTDPCLPHAYPIQAVMDACLQEMERCAKIFSALGARVINIHPCYSCPPSMRNDVVGFNIKSLKPIVKMAELYDLTVIIENYIAPFDRVSTFKKMFTAVPGLKLHLDIGHTNFGQDNHEVFCGELGEHIQHVHFSDNRSKFDDHMPLGVGNIDWEKVTNSLKATGYDSTITLEVLCSGDPDIQYKYLDMSRKLILELWN